MPQAPSRHDLKGGVSREAQDFLDNLPAPDLRNLATMDIQALRREARQLAEEASLAALSRYGVTTRDVEIAGIHCLEITPPDEAEGQVLLYLFGGAFIMGGPFEDLPISAALAAHAKSRVIVPYYRLLPENPFPAGLEDCWSVAEHLAKGRERSDRWGSSKGWSLAGESAGGNLALAVLHRLRERGLPMPSATALLSPASDLSNLGESFLFNADRDPSLNPEFCLQISELYAKGRALDDPSISPLWGSFSLDYPATLITTGTRDLFLSSCCRLARVMRDAGVTCDLRVWEGMWHVFEYYPLPEAEASLQEIGAFFRLHCA